MFLQLLSLSQDFMCLCIQEVVLMKLSAEMYIKNTNENHCICTHKINM